MLPFCNRVVSVARKEISPVWTRSFPVSRQPQTIGEHLRKQRFNLGIRQSEAAERLGVSGRTLSLWECDQMYPAWSQQPKVTAYLGYDPFINPALGRPTGNETPSVAFLSSNEALSFGQEITKRRIQLKKTRKECAHELGLSMKTLWGWETNRCQPSAKLLERVAEFLGFDPAAVNATSDF
jgi:transcriptional regulator with XRE-family HTH domain